MSERLERVNVVCGGFPCQDVSVAGDGAGIAGERSGLWRPMAHTIRVVRPDYAVVENVAALLYRGLGEVLGDLAEGGYDAEWDCVPASAVGAPHQRDRVWIVAYPDTQRELQPEGRESDEWRRLGDGGQEMADADSARLERRLVLSERPDQWAARQSGVGDADRASENAHAAESGSRPATSQSDWWRVEPDVGRVAHGVPARVDRLRGLGNAVVPQIAQWIAERIKAAEAGRMTQMSQTPEQKIR